MRDGVDLEYFGAETASCNFLVLLANCLVTGCMGISVSEQLIEDLHIEVAYGGNASIQSLTCSTPGVMLTQKYFLVILLLLLLYQVLL